MLILTKLITIDSNKTNYNKFGGGVQIKQKKVSKNHRAISNSSVCQQW